MFTGYGNELRLHRAVPVPYRNAPLRHLGLRAVDYGSYCDCVLFFAMYSVANSVDQRHVNSAPIRTTTLRIVSLAARATRHTL
jgi:hypothetical protein